MTDERNPYKGRGRIIDAGVPTVREPLRRPGNNDTAGHNAGTSPSVGASTSSKGLSVDAPVFVPRGLSAYIPPEPAYVPQPQAQQLNGEVDYSNNSLDQVRTVIYEMSVDPGEFDTLAHYLSDALNASITDENTLAAVVDEIFEQSIIDSNLRYNGSRLCNYLSNNLTLQFGDCTFRNVLLKRCQQEFNQRTTYAKTPDGRARLRSFSMFMGELFIHMEIVTNNSHNKIALLGESLPDLLDTLIKHSTTEDVKCVCQILKFTGAAMEDLPNSDHKKLNDLFEVMKAIASQESIDRISKDMLQNVIKLRESSWGRGTPTSTLNIENISLSQLPTTDPVFYGPDGVPISNEEARFLESDKYLYNDNPEDEYNESEFARQNPHLWSSADGMDDEMAEDYEKFLMENS